MPHASRLALLVLAASGVMLAGCTAANKGATGDTDRSNGKNGMATTSPSMDAPLYATLGGDAGISKIVDDTVARMQSDDALSARISKLDVPAFKTALTAKAADLTGGPNTYMGKDAKTAATGMNISDAEWNAFIKDLTDALNDQKVEPLAREELLVKVLPMKADIVGQ
jgi:hemoglobin